MYGSTESGVPVLVNTIGHSAGCLIFGTFLYLFLRDSRRARFGRSMLPAVAAALALLWNVGSLVVLAAGSADGVDGSVPAAFSFSVLSFLPAVLLHISTDKTGKWFVRIGYGLSSAAVVLHVTELFIQDVRLHEAALLLISVGFGALTLTSAWTAHKTQGEKRPVRGLASMALFLLATSFVHFGTSHSQHLWSEEIALHHAGIPLSLIVLLQEHRFLLLDVFVRFFANALLAAGLIGTLIALNSRFDLMRLAQTNSFAEGLLLVAGCVALIAFSQIRTAAQALMTRVVFRRPALSLALGKLSSEGAESEHEYLSKAAANVAEYTGAERYEVRPAEVAYADKVLLPQPLPHNMPDTDQWAQAIVPLRFSSGDVLFLLLGRRAGGRLYLSEDFAALARFSLAIVNQVERLRSDELRRLAAQAELRALQAQIHPHFLFNALNAVYGTIPRQATGARNAVLNLADIFRYFLQTDKTFIALEEEMRIVSAYLQIEQLRLGDRLQTSVEIADNVGSVHIPALSVQPLVENAIKHGVAAKPGPGSIHVRIDRSDGTLRIEVQDSGGTFDSSSARDATGSGVGLENVRRRLKLCYGSAASVNIQTDSSRTLVTLLMPVKESTTPAVRSPAETVA